jgi:hypothetical protein
MAEAVSSSRSRIVYICGWGRSGSTIADRLLGTLPGFFSAGELRSLWDYDPLRHQCACGATVSTCPMWSPALSEVFGELVASSFASIRAERDRSAKSRHFVSLIRAASPSGAASRYGDLLTSVYASVLSQSGDTVVVDSSKHPAEAVLLAARSDIDLTVIHLVRDPRGVAYSWKRRTHGAQSGDRPPQRGIASTTAWWDIWNAVADLSLRRRLGNRYIRLRYEDLMRDPRTQFAALAETLGANPASLPFSDATTVSVLAQHTVAGNPARAGTGSVVLTLDEEWVDRMPPLDRALSSVIAFPFLRRFGYPMAAGPSRTLPKMVRPLQGAKQVVATTQRAYRRREWRQRSTVEASPVSLPRGTRRIYHHHVRKTGGTSLNRAFLTLGGEDPATVHRRMRGALHVAESGGLRFVAHDRVLLREGEYFYGWDHAPAWSIELPSETFTITVLRDPVARLLSLYRYLADAGSDRGEPFRAGRLERMSASRGLGQFLDQVDKSDALNQLHMFSPTYSVTEAADRIRKCSAWFMTEHYDAGISALGSVLGLALPMRWDRRSTSPDVIAVRERDRMLELLEPEYNLLRALHADPGQRLAGAVPPV